MKRAKRTQTEPLHVQLLREGILESIHQAEAVVCDVKGRVLMSAGDPEMEAFIRSALKPFQALAAINTGTLDRFSLSDRDLAIMCASTKATSSNPAKPLTSSGTATLIPPPSSVPPPPASVAP